MTFCFTCTDRDHSLDEDDPSVLKKYTMNKYKNQSKSVHISAGATHVSGVST
jgi:hypothetical protein